MISLEQNFTVRYRYPVHFSRHALSPENALLAHCLDGPNASRRALFIVDRGLLACHPGLLSGIDAYCRTHGISLPLAPLVIDGGETAKNDPRHLATIQAAIHHAGLCRHSYVVALGGGALLDTAGLAAASAHRGIRLVRMPTTVLAQCDAGVGVKNGINAFGKKNFLGTFAPPYAVINDAQFLVTLSLRDWRAGLAEAVKAALLKEPAFFDFLEHHAPLLLKRDLVTMEASIYRCAYWHLRHIAEHGDPFEQGSSRPLDFGHWAAHKLEQLSAHNLRHGEAVAIGIALDVTYSYLSGWLEERAWQRILRLLSCLGFRVHVPMLDDAAALLAGLREFREHLGGELTITLLRDIGEAFDVHSLDMNRIALSIELLRDHAADGPEPPVQHARTIPDYERLGCK